jgi:hypothetical protein
MAEGGTSKQNSRGNARRDREAVSGERDIDTRTIVMPGLDPGIHQPSHKHFSEEDGLPGQARQ